MASTILSGATHFIVLGTVGILLGDSIHLQIIDGECMTVGDISETLLTDTTHIITTSLC
jgi:hypothetical protein